jgi:DUF177 domain-containing protein
VKMQFDLRQLGRSGGGGSLREEHVDRTFEPSAFATPDAESEEYRVTAPVHLVMDIHKDGTAYRVTGRIDTRLRLECGRCLEPFEIAVDSPFELRYVPQADTAADEEREVSEDDLTTAFYHDEKIDLAELMHEQFMLALPMKPLCSATCKGLCVHCGTNMNRESCACAPQWTDPRLSVLKNLTTNPGD